MPISSDSMGHPHLTNTLVAAADKQLIPYGCTFQCSFASVNNLYFCLINPCNVSTFELYLYMVYIMLNVPSNKIFIYGILQRLCWLNLLVFLLGLDGPIPQSSWERMVFRRKPPLGCALALAKGNLWLSSGPMVRHNCHGMTTPTHPSPFKRSFSL